PKNVPISMIERGAPPDRLKIATEELTSSTYTVGPTAPIVTGGTRSAPRSPSLMPMMVPVTLTVGVTRSSRRSSCGRARVGGRLLGRECVKRRFRQMLMIQYLCEEYQ